MTSSSRGRGMVTQINSPAVENTTQQIAHFFDAVQNATSQSKKKKGMGCFTVVRASSDQPMSVELMDKSDIQNIVSAWDVLRRWRTSRKNTALQNFHLHGVMFMMVPHVTDQDPGTVTVSLRSSNNHLENLGTVTWELAKGPAVATMAPSICLPLLMEDVMFYYTTTCEGSPAVYPCSVMAIWKQEITTRVSMYKDEQISSWFLDKLSHPQLASSSTAAARLIANHFCSEQVISAPSPQSLLGFEQQIESMDVLDSMRKDQIARFSQAQQKPLVVQSQRFAPIVIPRQNLVPQRFSDVDAYEEGSVPHANVRRLPKAQGLSLEDQAYFNVMHGFCGNQHSDTFAGDSLYIGRENLIEAANMQELFDGRIQAFDLMDADYFSIGVLPPQLHFLKLFFLDGILPHDLPQVYHSFLLDCFEEGIEPATDKWAFSVSLAQQEVEAAYEEIERNRPYLDCMNSDVVPIAQAGDVSLPAEDVSIPTYNSFQGLQINQEQDVFLDASDSLFDFAASTNDVPHTILELQQPLVVTSRSLFEVGVYEFKWNTDQAVCSQLLEIPLPEAFNAANTLNPAGVQLLRYFDAGIIEFEASVHLSASFAVTGTLVLLWDECNVLKGFKDAINQATLTTVNYMLIPAGEPTTQKMVFTPRGVGKFVPFDQSITSSNLGSLRLYVLYPLSSSDPTFAFPGHIHLRARMLSTNVMQAPRAISQGLSGVQIGDAYLGHVPCSQTLMSSTWTTEARMGQAFVCTFSPASVFEQNSTLQPSILCNTFRNCKSWTGTCEFELYFDKCVFHEGSLGIGFGTLASKLTNAYSIYNTPHVVATVSGARVYRFEVNICSWNGKNLFSTGRKSSLPKLEHEACLQIFAAVLKPLTTTSTSLDSISFYLKLRSIKNLVLSGSTPMRPVFGHWKEGKSGVDFFYSESSGPQAKLLSEMLKLNLPAQVKPRALVAQGMVREKYAGDVRQYMVKKIDKDKRYLALPVAPWSFEFDQGSNVVASEVNPFIDACSSFLYWRGSLIFTIILHRKQASANAGGHMSIVYEASGYPIKFGEHDGTQPLASGGGPHCEFSFGGSTYSTTFAIEDDNFFERRYTRYMKFDSSKSRIDTFVDRLGTLCIYLPSPEIINQVEIKVALGPDFVFSHPRIPTPSTEATVGDMTSHLYEVGDGGFTPIEATPGLFKAQTTPSKSDSVEE